MHATLYDLIQTKDFSRVHLYLMSMQLMHSVHSICTFNGTYVNTVNQSNYSVDSNTKYSNYMKLQLKGLNYIKI